MLVECYMSEVIHQSYYFQSQALRYIWIISHQYTFRLEKLKYSRHSCWVYGWCWPSRWQRNAGMWSSSESAALNRFALPISRDWKHSRFTSKLCVPNSVGFSFGRIQKALPVIENLQINDSGRIQTSNKHLNVEKKKKSRSSWRSLKKPRSWFPITKSDL